MGAHEGEGGRRLATSMSYHDVVILLPGHGLEDFPTDLPDDKAAGLLNAFAVTWHPALLAAVKSLPREHRADDPPASSAGRLILVPPACEDGVPEGWIDQARSERDHVSVCLNGTTWSRPSWSGCPSSQRRSMPNSSPISSLWGRAGCSSSC